MLSRTIEEIVQRMVQEHFGIEPSVETIIWFKDEEGKEIRLLELNTESTSENLILPFYHKPTAEYPMPAIVADITPEEWEKVRQSEIPLPSGWSLDDIVIFERERILQSQHNAV